jgi:hypothetical protein
VTDEVRPDKLVEYANVPLSEYLVIEPADECLILFD